MTPLNSYPVEEELKTRSNTHLDTPVKVQVQQQFKSSAYIRLSDDLRVASGQCGFNIVQCGNRKFVSKSTDLVIQNRFSCQIYTLYKCSKNEITVSREYRKYTLHNDRRNQRDEGRKSADEGTQLSQ